MAAIACIHSFPGTDDACALATNHRSHHFTADPAAAPDVATVVSGIMDQIIAAAAPQVHATGMAMWRGLAAILVAWTGLRIAFTGDFQAVGCGSGRHRALVPLGDAHLL